MARFPDVIAAGAKFTVGNRVAVYPMPSGHEDRVIDVARRKVRCDLSTGMRTRADVDQVLEWHAAHEGRAYVFRVKDYSDFRLDPTHVIMTGTESGSPATPDEQTVQVQKPYTANSRTYLRSLYALVAGTIQIQENGSDVAGNTGYTIDYDTGEVTGSPAAGVNVTIKEGGEFDVVMRFEDDELDLGVEYADDDDDPDEHIVQISSIRLVEVFEALS